MAEHNDFGIKAENAAAEFLESKGYKILARNFRFQKAEIDIIAECDNAIVIAEVKARSNSHFMQPYEAVNKLKIKNIVISADAYARKNNIDKDLRFDIISVLSDASGHLQITHIESAFESFDAI